MDGFDLGIGILFPGFRVGGERDMAMNSIAPVWDGNETWLVLGGGGLLAAFSLANAIVLPAFYAPLIVMLLGLIFRGVALEFRWRDPAHCAGWEDRKSTRLNSSHECAYCMPSSACKIYLYHSYTMRLHYATSAYS